MAGPAPLRYGSEVALETAPKRGKSGLVGQGSRASTGPDVMLENRHNAGKEIVNGLV